jgi:hypothetical protein
MEVVIAQHCDEVNATEFFTLKWLILCFVNFTLLKQNAYSDNQVSECILCVIAGKAEASRFPFHLLRLLLRRGTNVQAPWVFASSSVRR